MQAVCSGGGAPPDDVGAVPVDGTAYPITLGATFTHPGAQESYHLLQYASFKPASLSEEEPGALQYARGGSVRPVLAEFRNRTKAGETVRVQGNYVELKETECVLIFDGASFRLERLAGSGRRMNVVRPSRASTTPAVASSTPQKSEVSPPPALQATIGPPAVSSSSSPPSTGVSSVSYKRPRASVAAKTPVPSSFVNGSAGKRPRSTAATDDDDHPGEDGDDHHHHGIDLSAEKGDPEVMDFEEVEEGEEDLQEQSGGGGDDDLLSLASELEMDLQQHPEETFSAKLKDDTAGSLFSDDDDEDSEPHGDRSANYAAAAPVPTLSAATASSAAIAGKSLPAPAAPYSDSESDSDSGSDSGSDSESESESGSSGSDSDSESD